MLMLTKRSYTKKIVHNTYTHTHIPTDQLCSKANEVNTTSRTLRGEIKPLVVSVQASKTEAHGKIHTAISESVEQAKVQKVCELGRKKIKMCTPRPGIEPGSSA